MKTYRVNISVSIDANDEKIAESIVANRLVSGKGVNEVSVVRVEEI